MERTKIKDLKEKVGERVLLKGWIDTRRDHGKLIFIDLRDSTGKVQMVVLPNHEGAKRAAEESRSEWVIEVEGTVNKRPEKMVNPDEENGGLEVEAEKINTLSKAKELPFEKDEEVNIDTELDYRPLTLRKEKNKAIFKIQAAIVKAFRDFLIKEDFTEIQAPKLVGSDAEGGGNVFQVEYFKDKKAYLATSPQLYKEIMVGVFERVFAVGDVFRAEKHSTSRHVNEYTSLDIEYGFIKDHTDIMKLESKLLAYVFKYIGKTCQKELKIMNADLPAVPDKIPAMKLREAQKVIKKETGADKTGEPDLDPEDERFMCEYAKKEFGSDFIFITHYPVSKRPFYTFEDEDDPGYTKSFDLLFRGIEITTGGQRIHDYDMVVKAIEKKGLKPESFSFYLQAFKYGMPPHGGFGMGLERLTAKILGLENVKEAVLFPREMNRIDTLLSQ